MTWPTADEAVAPAREQPLGAVEVLVAEQHVLAVAVDERAPP